MDIKIESIKQEEKELLWKLLQLALYDGSFYVDNQINDAGEFEYNWFDCYFTDNDRFAYLIKCDKNIAGFALVNGNLKIKHDCNAQTIAEFLILPQYRKRQIGKKAAHMIFDKFDGVWEVQPMDNNDGAYKFWEKIIKEYTNDQYKIYNFEDQEDVLFFKSKMLYNYKQGSD